MALSREQSIQLYGTEAYTGWGEAEASADFNAKGGSSGGSSGDNSDSIIQNAINSILGIVKTPPKPYEEANPFFFDEQLAREASTAEYAPYYDETLSDYISRVERTKTRSASDLKSLLSYLSASKEHFLGAERRALDKSERQANEGYAGSGLFFSGVRQRDLRELDEASQARVSEYDTGYQYRTGEAQTGHERTMEDLTTEETQKRRDIEREKKYAIETGVLGRKGEVRDEYEISKKKYYDDYLSGYV